MKCSSRRSPATCPMSSTARHRCGCRRRTSRTRRSAAPSLANRPVPTSRSCCCGPRIGSPKTSPTRRRIVSSNGVSARHGTSTRSGGPSDSASRSAATRALRLSPPTRFHRCGRRRVPTLLGRAVDDLRRHPGDLARRPAPPIAALPRSRSTSSARSSGARPSRPFSPFMPGRGRKSCRGGRTSASPRGAAPRPRPCPS